MAKLARHPEPFAAPSFARKIVHVRHTFIDLGEFISEHSALIARAYEQSGAARWGLSLDKFASAVHVSISACREAPEQAVLSLRWSDLGIGCRVPSWHRESLGRIHSSVSSALVYSRLRNRRRRPQRARTGGLLVRRLVRDGSSPGAWLAVGPFPCRSSLATWLRAVLAQPSRGLPARVAPFRSARTTG